LSVLFFFACARWWCGRKGVVSHGVVNVQLLYAERGIVMSKRHQPFMVLGKVDSDRAVKTTNEGQGKKREALTLNAAFPWSAR